jgi:hypothetical protein
MIFGNTIKNAIFLFICFILLLYLYKPYLFNINDVNNKFYLGITFIILSIMSYYLSLIYTYINN